ncbi:hypothetical protein Bca4012_035289 [Brassica carinata]
MKYSLCFVLPLLVISFMLLFATEMDLVEARTNEVPSRTFQGWCVLETKKCIPACIKEHYEGGRCRKYRCYCVTSP